MGFIETSSRAVCILGMHRSGTSSFARGINLLGVSLGNESSLVPASQENPEGYWEHGTIVELHERLFSSLSSSWDSKNPLPTSWWDHSQIVIFKQELFGIINDQFLNKPLWGWKDPRTCILLPLWESLLEEMEVLLSCVIVIRNPLDVARSLKKRNGFSMGHSFALWEYYTLSALIYSSKFRRVLCTYDNYLEQPVETLKKISEQLDIPWPENDHRLENDLMSFLRSELRHSKSTDSELSFLLDIPKSLQETYRLCLEADRNPNFLRSTDFMIRVEELLNEYNRYAAIFGTEATEYGRMQVYWPSDEGYKESLSDAVTVVTDGSIRTYEFEVPAGINGEIRLDPIDRLASVQIHEIQLIRKKEKFLEAVLWSCNLSNSFTGLHSISNAHEIKAEHSYYLISSSNDPHLFIDLRFLCPIPSESILQIKLSVSNNSELTTNIFQLNILHQEDLLSLYGEKVTEFDHAISDLNIEREKIFKLEAKYQREENLVDLLIHQLEITQSLLIQSEYNEEYAFYQITSKETELYYLQQIIFSKNSELEHIINELMEERETSNKTSREITEMNKNLMILNECLEDKEIILSEIENSWGYRLLKLTSLIFRLLLDHHYRNRLFNFTNFKKALYYIRREGLRGLYYKFQNKIDRVDDLGFTVWDPYLSNQHSERLGVLIVTHTSGGGSSLFLDQKINELMVNYRVYKMDLVGNQIRISNLNERLVFYRSIDEWESKSLQELVRRLEIKLIYVNNLVSFPAYKMMQLIQSSQVDYAIFIHDFFCACPSFNLINSKGYYCGAETNTETCKACLRNGLVTNHWTNLSGLSVDISNWRDEFSNFLAGAIEVLAPSEMAKSIVNKYYPDIKIKVQEHSISPAIHYSYNFDVLKDKRLTIAFLGTLSKPKGSAIVEELRNLVFQDNVPLNIKVIGVTERYTRPFRSKNGTFEVTGRYSVAELSDILKFHRVALVVVPTFLPETFMYTAEEAIKSGFPVATFPIGAQVERILRYNGGWVLKDSTCSGLFELLTNLEKSREEIRNKAKNLLNLLVNSGESSVVYHTDQLNSV